MSESYEAVDENIVRALPRLVDELGGDSAGLLLRVGLSPKGFALETAHPSYRQAIDLVALASSELGCKDFGMRLAMAQLGTFRSPLLRLIENAKTLGEALQLVCTHSYAHSLAMSIWLNSAGHDETVAYGLDILLDGVPNRGQAMEQILLIAYRSIRELTCSRVTARRVTFRHEQISDTKAYRRFFGCEVKFGQQADAVIFAAADLDCPIFREGDDDAQAAIAAIEQRFVFRESPVQARVRGILMNRIGALRCNTEDVALKLGCSTKKLSRLLAKENTSFQAIKNRMRIELARYYVEGTPTSSTSYCGEPQIAAPPRAASSHQPEQPGGSSHILPRKTSFRPPPANERKPIRTGTLLSRASGLKTTASVVHFYPADYNTLMRMQNSYDIAQARKRKGEINVAPFTGKPIDPQPAMF